MNRVTQALRAVNWRAALSTAIIDLEMAELVRHPWNISVAEAARLQRELAGAVMESGPAGEIRRVAGVDLSGVRSDGKATAAAVLLSFPELRVMDTSVASGKPEFPYVPGFLSFRETPLVLDALLGLRTPPDLILVDGHGRAHPRRLGIASHLGLIVDVPTVGLAKSRLVGQHEQPADLVGATSPLIDQGEVIGMVLRSRRGSKPVFVSVGHRISLLAAVDLVMRCTLPGQRIPEPTRQAHLVASGGAPKGGSRADPGSGAEPQRRGAGFGVSPRTS